MWAIAAVCTVALAGCDQAGGGTTTKPDSAVVTEAPARQFTTKQFDNYAFDKTKAQIRSEFGPPDTVIESTDTWYYSSINHQLVISDADAGTRVDVWVHFSGMDGADNDRVAEVKF